MNNLGHPTEYWQRLLHGTDAMDVRQYLKMIEIFVDTGEVAGRGVVWPEDAPWVESADPLVAYLTRLMADSQIKARVLGSRLCGKIFYATVGRFVVAAKHEGEFFAQRQWTERNRVAEVLHWDAGRRGNTEECQRLIAQIGADHPDGEFDAEFYRTMFARGMATDDTMWAKMADDWARAIDRQRDGAVERYVRDHGGAQSEILAGMLRSAASHIAGSGIDENRAVQAWQEMNGRWSESEFQRRMTVVKLQDRYPQLEQMVNIMGRVPSSGGASRLSAASGSSMKIAHSAGSDIDGITTGSDLNSLLPIEMAQCVDDDTENAFFYRYVRRQLQTFRYKSNVASPSRRLSPEHASRKGPMIVCVDTSASMHGVPQRIIKCLLGIVEDVAERQRRDCFLIDFSVSVRAIDLMLRRKRRQYESIGLSPQEYAFEKGHLPFIGGGTDAKGMMELTFKLLGTEGGSYVNADVLWVSDFLIDESAQPLLRQMRLSRLGGTRFYTLRIVPEGTPLSHWAAHFDRMSDVAYRQIRRF